MEDRSDRMHYLLNVQPCEWLSAVDFWQQVVRYLLLRGNAYIVPVYDLLTMSVARLALVDPTTVAHDTVNDTYTINDVYAGISGVYDESEVLHIKNYSVDGKTGLSTIAYARIALDITSTGDQETLNRFANGGNVRGIVSNDNSVRGFGEYQDKELEKTATDLDSRFRGGERIVSLPGQVQFSPISLSSTDMQFWKRANLTCVRYAVSLACIRPLCLMIRAITTSLRKWLTWLFLQTRLIRYCVKSKWSCTGN